MSAYEMNTYKYKIIVGIAILFLFSFSAYQNSFQNGFIFDDTEQIVENNWIRDFRFIPTVFTSGVWSFRDLQQDDGFYYRPLMHVFYMVEYRFFGLDPYGWHVVNVIWHFLNSAVFFLFLLLFLKRILPEEQEKKILGGTFALAFFSAFLFVLHPINSEVANWVAAVPELSFTFFSLLALAAYFLVESKWLRYIFSLAFFTFALLCKETAIALPLVLFFYHFFTDVCSEKIFFKRIYAALRPVLPFFMIGGAYMIARGIVLGSIVEPELTRSFGSVAVITFFTSVFLFLRNIIEITFPFPLSAFHYYEPGPTDVYYAVAFLAPWIWLRYLKAHRLVRTQASRLVVFGILLFSLPLLPTLNYIYLYRGILSERYLYLPSMGFSLLAAYLFLVLFGRMDKRYVVGWSVLTLMAITGTFFVTIVERNPAWRDNQSIFSDAITKSPRSAVPQLKLAETYCEKGDIPACQKQYAVYCGLPLFSQEGLDTCLAGSTYYQVMGDTYYRKKDFDNALTFYAIAFGQNNSFAANYKNLGLVSYQMGESKNTKRYLFEALALAPGSASLNKDIGLLLCSEGDLAAAAPYFERAKELGWQNDGSILASETCVHLLKQ